MPEIAAKLFDSLRRLVSSELVCRKQLPDTTEKKADVSGETEPSSKFAMKQKQWVQKLARAAELARNSVFCYKQPFQITHSHLI